MCSFRTSLRIVSARSKVAIVIHQSKGLLDLGHLQEMCQHNLNLAIGIHQTNGLLDLGHQELCQHNLKLAIMIHSSNRLQNLGHLQNRDNIVLQRMQTLKESEA